MDILIVIIIAAVLCLKNAKEIEYEEVMIVRETRLNPNFYVDENAFMEVAHALGFGDDSVDTNTADMGVRP